MYAISRPPSLSSQQCRAVAYATVCVASLFVGMATARVLATQMSPRVVETQYGKVRGVLVTLSNRNLPQVESYLGIQYASLLGGELRFMPPTSTMEKWDGIRVALKYRPVCPQRLPPVEELEAAMPRPRVEHFLRLYPFLERQQEDCLSLNIYVPLRERTADQGTHGPPSSSSSSSPSQALLLLPVLVFIHGESYAIGSGNAYDGSVMAAYSQIVVVTLNYRLGALGFLTTGDSNAPGNYALLDVVAALRWIQENVRPFGGNSSDVTLVGQGHGAVMANLLLLSPITRGRHLFHRVILQSGSALSPWAIVSDPLVNTRRLAEALNCSAGGHWGARSTPLIQCLKDAPYQDILAASSSLEDPSRPPAAGDPLSASFGPTVDHRSVVSADVRTLVGSRAVEAVFSSVPLVVGFTAAEGLSHVAQSVVDEGLGLDLDALRSAVARLVERVFRRHRQTIFEILLHQYRNWERPSDPHSNLASLVDLIGDALYAVPALEMALYHSAATSGGTTTFVYCFNYSQSDVTAGNSYPGHGSDLVYLFGGPISDGIDPFHGAYTRSEKAFSEVLLQYFNQFIRTGSFNDPTQFYQRGRSKVGGRFVSANLPELAEWPPFDPKGQEILLMESRPQVRRQFRASHLSLWLNLIPKIHRSKDLDVCYHLLRSSAARAPSAESSSYLDGGGGGTVAPPCDGITARSSTRGSTTFGPGSIPSQRSSSSISGFARTSSFPEISKNQRTSAAPTPSAIRRDKPDHVTSTEQTTAAASRGPSNRVQQQQTPHAASNSINDYRLSLCVVIATGCVLLLMNVLMLSCVYCRKVKALRGGQGGQGKAFLAVGDDRSCETITRFHRIADLPKALPSVAPLPLPPPISSAQNHHGVPPSCPQRSVSLPKPKEPEHPDGSTIS